MGDEKTQEKEAKTSGGFDFNAALERVKRFATTGIEHASIYAPSFSNFEFISRPLADARGKVATRKSRAQVLPSTDRRSRVYEQFE